MSCYLISVFLLLEAQGQKEPLRSESEEFPSKGIDGLAVTHPGRVPILGQKMWLEVNIGPEGEEEPLHLPGARSEFGAVMGVQPLGTQGGGDGLEE